MKNLKKKLSPFFKRIWPFLLITVIVGSFFWKFFLRDMIPLPGDFVVGVYYPWLDYKWGYSVGVPVKNPITADVPSFIYPMQTFAIDTIKSGKLPLWNPLILMGTPLLANFQSAPFAVTNFLYFVTDKLTAWGLQVILQHFFAALFTYLLLRYWKVSKLGSLLGGVIFAFSGFNLIWSEWNGHALSAAFIPLIIFFEDKWLTENKIKNAVGFSLVLCLQILSGYPQVVLYTLLAIFVFGIIKLAQFPEKAMLFRVCALAIFALLGFGLAAFQVLPGAELLKNSQRVLEPHPFEWAFLPWQKVVTFISSDFFGNHSTNNYWGPQDYTSNTGFVGVVGFVLALSVLPLIKKKSEVVFGFSLSILALLLAFPTPVSIFLWRSGVLGFNAAAAHRSLVLFNLGVSFLAAFGYDRLKIKTNLKSSIFSCIVPFVFIIGFAVYAFLLKDKMIHDQSVFSIAVRNLLLPFFILSLTSLVVLFKQKLKPVLICLAVVELFYFGWKFMPFSNRNIDFPTTPVIDFLQNQEKPFRVNGNKIIPMNMLMTYGLESPEGYDAVYIKNTSKFISALNDGTGDTNFSGRYGSINRYNSPLLNLINTKYLLALKVDAKGSPSSSGFLPQIYKNSKFVNVFEDKSVVVLQNKEAMPRAFMVYDWESGIDDKEALGKLFDPTFPLGKKVVLSDLVNIKPDQNIKGTDDFVRYNEYSSQGSEIQVHTNYDGLLFVSDAFYPGWKVSIDGEPSKIYRADFSFRAVVIPKGDHTVVFDYEPKSFKQGIVIAVFSLIALGGLLLLY